MEIQSDSHEATTTNKRKDQYNVKRIKGFFRKKIMKTCNLTHPKKQETRKISAI